MNKIIGIFLFGLLSAGSAFAQSQSYSVYYDRAAWLKAVADAGITPPIGTQTFEGIPVGLYTYGLTDVGGVGYTSGYISQVSVSQLVSGGRVLHGAGTAEISTDPATIPGIRAIGFDLFIEANLLSACLPPANASLNILTRSGQLGGTVRQGGFVGVITAPGYDMFVIDISDTSGCGLAVLLDNVSYPGGPDSSVSNPNPPVPCPDGVPPGTHCFTPPTPDGPAWYDPPATEAFDFSSPDAKFISINDFPPGFASPFTVTTGGVILGSFLPGQSVQFPNGGVNEFRISGISPTVDGGNPYAFPINLSLDKVGVIFTMRPAPTSTPTPTLGNYADRFVSHSGDTTVAPSAAPTNTTSMNVSTSTHFKGKLEADPSTGSVRVTDAHPAGTYTVTVKAFNGSNGPTTTKTFTLTVTTPPTCNPVSFAATNFNVGARVGEVVVGDFNGDGNQDLAIGAINGILLGDGAGGFTAVPGSATAPSGPFVAGDFKGDGKQDLAVLNSNNVSILLGDGTGHFNGSNNSNTGCANPFALAAGDFNGDGKLDVATACYFTDTVTILLGDGAGGFGASASFGVSAGPQGLAVGDFNGDGKQDLAIACYTAGKVSILLGNGAGTFAPATSFNAGATTRDVEVGDFNGDGRQDLVVSNPSTNSVSVLLGDGAGGFGASASFGVGSNPSTVIAVGDFNGDGKQDLAVPNFGSSNVSILLGNGVGGFGPAVNFGVGLSPFGVAVGDFNGDGMQDLATPNWDSNNVSILLRDCAPAETQINNVITSINNTVLIDAGIKTSLNAKLQAAVAALQSGDIATACSKLQDCLNEVRAQRGKKIPADVADALANSVMEIRAELGCG